LIRDWTQNKTLTKQLKQVRIGKYALLSKSFTELAHSGIDLATCTVEDLEVFPGIGAKTARLFVLHTRKGQEYAVIDTHMLKEMRALNMTTLRATPAGKKYAELEKKLVAYLKKKGVQDFAEYDLGVWKKYALRKNPPK
jgi:endonuclease III